MKLDAAYYKANSSIQQTLANELLCKHTFSETDSVLDIGCGDGKITYEIARLCNQGQAVGIDISHEMIALANETHKKHVDNLTFKQKDAAVPQGFGHKQYDVVVSLNCLYWVKAIEQACRNCFNALKPSGHFLGLIYPKESEYWRPFEKVLRESPTWQRYYQDSCCPYWKEGNELLSLLNAIGFDEVNSSFEPGLAQSTAEEYINYIRGWIPCLFSASKEEHEQFMQAVLSEAKQHYWHSDHLEIPYTKLHLYLKRPNQRRETYDGNIKK